MISRTTGASPLVIARAAGAFWLLTILAGSMALFLRGGMGRNASHAATVAYIAVSLLMFALMKPVSAALSAVAAVCGVLGCIAPTALALLAQAGDIAGLNFVFFGLHCLLVGVLIVRSAFLPLVLGGLMAIGGLSWLTMGAANLLSPGLAALLSPHIMLPGILGEVSLTIWLLVKGVDVSRWEARTSGHTISGPVSG